MRSYEIEELPLLPADFEEDRSKDYLGFQLYDYYGFPLDKASNFNYFSKDYNRIMALYGSEYMISVTNYEAIGKTEVGEIYSIEKRIEDSVFRVYQGDEVILEIDLNDAAARFYLDQSENLSFTSNSGELNVILVFQSIDGQIDSSHSPVQPEDLVVQYFEVRVLLDLNR